MKETRRWLSDLLARLRAGRPGGRFQALHDQGRLLHHPLARLVAALLGGALVLAGLVMCVTPGPGVLTIAAGLAVWSLECPPLARLLDAGEVRALGIWDRHLRGPWQALRRRFSRR